MSSETELDIEFPYFEEKRLRLIKRQDEVNLAIIGEQLVMPYIIFCNRLILLSTMFNYLANNYFTG